MPKISKRKTQSHKVNKVSVNVQQQRKTIHNINQVFTLRMLAKIAFLNK